MEKRKEERVNGKKERKGRRAEKRKTERLGKEEKEKGN